MVEAREAPSISEGDCLEFRDGRLVIIDHIKHLSVLVRRNPKRHGTLNVDLKPLKLKKVQMTKEDYWNLLHAYLLMIK